MESLKEIITFMNIDSRLDLKAVAVSHILSLTGCSDARSLIYKCPEVIEKLLKLTVDNEGTIAKDALLAIVNLSADEEGANTILEKAPNLVVECIKFILDENCALADAWAMILSNISRTELLAKRVMNDIQSSEDKLLEKLVSAFTRVDFNKKNCHLNYLGPIFSNLSQTSEGRSKFCNLETKLLSRLLPFIYHEDSLIRRGGAVGLLKNICFDSSRHSWLMTDEDVNVLAHILLPLAGPEEYTDEENDKFPVDLQYLGADKKRESDPDLRKMLLESLAQLCATRKVRDFLRAKGTYEILRELHKFECSEDGDKACLMACENVVDILIRTEEEIGEDNLKDLDIPNELADKFEKMDSNLIET
ncbi:Protein HGH1 like [Pseudolycoriella hygida]|uniref:Protein HGH1 homolog n=1 Tax=Pseudolycoriella hygida TaxID=35572 RepID=A0A9Q0ML68_9DIPT|nr:Protein HGH1 like [Pseudolycoriella hygida]